MSRDARLKAVFMGTPDFAVPVLAALAEAGHDVAGVYTQPDRRAGRGRRSAASPVKRYALAHGLPVLQPASLRRNEQAVATLGALAPDVVVVAAYGLFLPTAMLETPRLGCLNIHPSLLPLRRGPSPVASAILEGDATTGVTVIRLDDRMDHGPIIAQRRTPIRPHETAGALTARLFRLGGKDAAGETARAGPGRPAPRGPGRIACHDHPSARQAGRGDRLGPSRGAHSPPGPGLRPLAGDVHAMGGTGAWPSSRPPPHSEPQSSGPAGLVTVFGEGIGVVTGEGVLELQAVRIEGRTPVTGADFARGHRRFVGSVLGAE